MIWNITYSVTFLYERPDLWFDLFDKINKVTVALHHPTRHDKDLGASHWVNKREEGQINKDSNKRKRDQEWWLYRKDAW